MRPLTHLGDMRRAAFSPQAAIETWRQALDILEALRHPTPTRCATSWAAPTSSSPPRPGGNPPAGRSTVRIQPEWAYGHHAARRSVDAGGSFRQRLAVPAGGGP